MGALARMLSPEWILLDEAAPSRAEIIRLLIGKLEASGDVLDAERLYEDVMQREQMSGTSIGNGCAVPHAHSSGIQATRVAAARLPVDCDCTDEDGEETRLVFLLVGPPTNTAIHLKVLSKLARLLHDPEFRLGLLEAPDGESFYHRVLGEG